MLISLQPPEPFSNSTSKHKDSNGHIAAIDIHDPFTMLNQYGRRLMQSIITKSLV